MFLATYKNTIKNIIRAPTFWLLLLLFVFEFIDVLTTSHFGYYDLNLKEQIFDTDVRFVVTCDFYLKYIANSYSYIMFDIMPIFTAVTTVLVLNRDYGDNLYEIEKAAGIKPTHYFFGRLTALGTFLIGIGFVVCFARFHTYIFTRGGVPSMDLVTYFTDSTVRLLRIFIFTAIPPILVNIAFTYCFGTLFRSGIPAAVVSVGYGILNTVVYQRLRLRMNPLYFDYVSPPQLKLFGYLYYYDTDKFEQALEQFETDIGKAALCVCILVGLAVLCSSIAYLRTRKRDR